MYGIIASAIVVAAASIALIKKLEVKTISGDRITIPPKSLGLGVRYAAGGARSSAWVGPFWEPVQDRCSRSWAMASP